MEKHGGPPRSPAVQRGEGEPRPTYRSSTDRGWARARAPPPRREPRPRRRRGTAAAAAAGAAAGRPGSGARASPAAPCRSRPLRAPDPRHGRRGIFLRPRTVVPRSERRARSSSLLLFVPEEKEGKLFYHQGTIASAVAGAAAATAAGGDAAAAAIARTVAGPSGERGRGRSAGGPADAQVLQVCEPRAPPAREGEGAGEGARPAGREGLGRGRGGSGGRGRNRAERTGRPDATYPPGALPCTWCDEICLEGFANKKNHRPTGFGVTNSRH